MYKMSSLVANAVLGAAKPYVGQAVEAGGGAVGGGIGKLIGGKKGAKIGKKVGRGIAKIGRKIFGFNDGGKVRQVPMRVRGYNAGGMILEPAVIRPLPRPRPRRK